MLKFLFCLKSYNFAAFILCLSQQVRIGCLNFNIPATAIHHLSLKRDSCDSAYKSHMLIHLLLMELVIKRPIYFILLFKMVPDNVNYPSTCARCHGTCEHLVWGQRIRSPTTFTGAVPPGSSVTRPRLRAVHYQVVATCSATSCTVGVQVWTACPLLGIMYIYQVLSLSSTFPWKSSPEISLKITFPTVNIHLIQLLNSTVSVNCESCIQPYLFLDIPQAGARPEAHLLSASSEQLVFPPASEITAVSKAEQQGKEMLSIWGAHSTKHMCLKAPEPCLVRRDDCVTKDTGGPRMTKRTRSASSQCLKRACLPVQLSAQLSFVFCFFLPCLWLAQFPEIKHTKLKKQNRLLLNSLMPLQRQSESCHCHEG